jgi:DNA polymerase
MDTSLWKEIIEDTKELVQLASNKRKSSIVVSPEAAEWIERVTAESASEPPGDTVSESPTDYSGSSDPKEQLVALAEEVSSCTKCGLCEGRTQTVFADGSADADLVFVGEAPGFYEDQQGIPFVGKAGQLLTDIITKGMKIKREEVYICNVIKCRPPENRDPDPQEKEQCEPYLIRQLELVQPKVICALGGHAAKTLLKTGESTGRLRGKWHQYQGIPLRVTYHPAYLLRNPEEKKKTWEDIQEVLKVLSGETNPFT